MNNYKIRVNNEAESREAQELFFELGYGWGTGRNKEIVTSQNMIDEGYSSNYKVAFIFAGEGGRLLNDDDSDDGYKSYVESDEEEITLPQLRDLVVKHRKQTGLISGADALRALADGEDVLWKAHSDSIACAKRFIEHPPYLALALDPNCDYQFWIKPRTVKLEIEVPAPFEPKVGDVFYALCPTAIGGYSKMHITDQKRMDDYAKLGAWRTEAEIKIVVEQLRKLKEHSK
ncbi:hypothetical protein [Acinetobacter ursingii]|uniref:hypothetical protein n=1 Tax=Acinetobacter ursingii TaxID=108980 RepID=UPI001250770A|nr:hypothetical protein [Acinetobacter ursingii]